MECGRRYTSNPKTQGYPQEVRDQAIKLHFAGASGRQAGKVLGMSKANKRKGTNVRGRGYRVIKKITYCIMAFGVNMFQVEVVKKRKGRD